MTGPSKGYVLENILKTTFNSLYPSAEGLHRAIFVGPGCNGSWNLDTSYGLNIYIRTAGEPTSGTTNSPASFIFQLVIMKYILSSLLLVAPVLAFPTSSDSLLERQATCPGLPSGFSFASDGKLPDPFTTAAGSKVTTKADWACRKKEISDMFQKYELGTLPGKPESVTGSVSTSSISVSVKNAGKSISFSASVKMPSGASGAVPAIITIGGSSIPIPAGVATINFNNDQMAAQQNKGSHGTGMFFDLYGKDHNAGALIAWAWGVSRILDIIEADTTNKIDIKRIGVTGCSRNGKGAFIVGAFDDRIALTIPQESGSGGAACWRISDSEHNAGKNIQTAGEIIGENAWFSPLFDQWATKTSSLPHDHHMLAAMTVPRGLLVIENNIDWLGPVSTTGCMRAGLEIYKAFGSDAMGFSETPGHNHCQFPSSQQPELTAFINKFLKGGNDATSVDKSDQNVKASNYISWTTPTLT
ncbi:Uncharacterized protein BP5553_10599 [Venustampulla echinocandica]|uniref:(4-O-methyl)-D-glucuronate--lignin esterase n=1 Tax=Venustampulla echinocandica TaxID=2656787 RepID=A0A370T905_9HELO|nr:Uncharacterized protein BP5553_10599 [Venustampulla echinocandica]RDL29972.1 Uncharacterized protein BP5553_10599 [Venustampulla echinocandica]